MDKDKGLLPAGIDCFVRHGGLLPYENEICHRDEGGGAFVAGDDGTRCRIRRPPHISTRGGRGAACHRAICTRDAAKAHEADVAPTLPALSQHLYHAVIRRGMPDYLFCTALCGYLALYTHFFATRALQPHVAHCAAVVYGRLRGLSVGSVERTSPALPCVCVEAPEPEEVGARPASDPLANRRTAGDMPDGIAKGPEPLRIR